MDDVAKKPETTNAAKKLARLAAVQVLYQASYEQQPLAHILRDALTLNFPSLQDEDADLPPQEPDRALFQAIVQGVAGQQAELDEILAGALSANLSISRMEVLLRTVLRAGLYELRTSGQIPAGIVINDYVDVAKAFYNSKEPGLVNGVLDKLAGKLRE